MAPKFEVDVTVNSVSEYVDLFAATGTLQPGLTRWFRGDKCFRRRTSLLPSIARQRVPSMPDREWEIYRRFRQNAASFLSYTTLTEWDWMLYMRHYAVPTRLLDWTESPLVALYFAVDDPRPRVDGIVWCLDPGRLNNLAGFEPRVYCAGVDAQLDNYTPTSIRTAPSSADFGPVALITARAFPRLVAQQGVFTVIHRRATSLEAIDDDALLSRVRIPADAKTAIRDHLDQLGVHRLTLFPELQSVATRVTANA